MGIGKTSGEITSPGKTRVSVGIKSNDLFHISSMFRATTTELSSSDFDLDNGCQAMERIYPALAKKLWSKRNPALSLEKCAIVYRSMI